MLASNPQQRASLPTSLMPTWEPSEMAKIGKLGSVVRSLLQDQWREPSLSASTLKPGGIRGECSASDGLQLGGCSKGNSR